MVRPANSECDTALYRGLPRERESGAATRRPRRRRPVAPRRRRLAHVRAFLLAHGVPRRGDRPGRGRRCPRPARGRPAAGPRERRYTQARGGRRSPGCRSGPGSSRFWRALGFADVERGRAGLHRPRHRGDRLFQGDGAASAPPTWTPPCSWPGSSARRWPGSPRPRWRPGDDGASASATDTVEAADRFASWPTSPAGHGPAARVRLAAPRPGGDPAHDAAAQPGPRCRRSPVLAVGLRRHGRVHHAEPAALRGGAGRRWSRRFEEVAHDIVTAPRGPGGQDDRRRGHVRGRQRRRPRPASGSAWPRPMPTTSCSPTSGSALAVGPVLVQDGDYYGPIVNLASRIVNIANPGTVLVSDEFHTDARWRGGARRVHRPAAPRPGSSRTSAGCSCGGAGGPARPPRRRHPADRRRNVRWERLAEVLRDLDDLREVGERLFARDRRTADDGDPEAQASATRRVAIPKGRSSKDPVEGAGGACPAGRPASPSGRPTRTVVGLSVGLKTRTSRQPASRRTRGHLGPLDLERAALGPPGASHPAR